MDRVRRTGALLVATVAAIVLCLGMVLVPRTEALADPTYTITVTDTKKDSTYTAYKVFDLVYSGSNHAYSIKSDSPFYQAVSNSNLFTLEQVGTEGSATVYSVALKDTTLTDSANLAAALKTALDELSPKPTAAASRSSAEDNAQLVLDVSSSGAGYYFVTTTTGTICSLDTTNPAASVRDKNSKPSVQKLVQEPGVGNGDYDYVGQNDANVGDVVNFRTKITVTRGGENYVLRDKLAPGLTLDTNSFKIGVTGDPEQAALLGTDAVPEPFRTGAELKTTGLTDGCTFELTLDNDRHLAFLNELGNDTASRDLYVFYSATVNSNAVVAGAGNPNETWLHFGAENETDHSITKTYTWPLTVVKYTGDDPTKNRLAGATFTLTRADADWNASGSALSFVKNASSTTYTLGTASGAVSSITTDATGTFALNGLDSGNYLLTETKAPDGYNKVKDPIKVTVGIDYDASALTMAPTYAMTSTSGGTNSNSGTVTLASGVINVQNRTGAEMPATGGAGTTVLYVVGGLLVVVAAGGLVAGRRHKASK